MPANVTKQLIERHLVEGDPGTAGSEIALRIDQTLTQDATGTLVMLALEALELGGLKTEVSAQYVDHNLLQTDHKNPDDHLFLESACRRWGIRFSRPGNGVSHPVHMERLGVPGKTLLGSDSHTPAAGSLGMLAFGAGGLDVALAMAGEPYRLAMPKIWGVRLTGTLPDWVSAKDVILEMLRRHGVDGGLGKIIEYHGPGLKSLSAMDRHVIANMGTELGATSTVFPSDQEVRRFLASQGREEAWSEILAGDSAAYDLEDEIDLSSLEPLIATPGSPGNVVPVREVAGRPVYQCVVGSSANPGLRDFAVTAMIVKGRQAKVSLDINPTSRQTMQNLAEMGLVAELYRSGARLHQPGCNGCIGMGQAPATGRISLRTVPRNFPGRSGTREDAVYLCSPETAAASALTGSITDPRDLEMEYPRYREPRPLRVDEEVLRSFRADPAVELVKGPNISSLPQFEPLPDELEGPLLLKVGDDVSTDEILPAGEEVLPFRSNIAAISRFTFSQLDEEFAERAAEHDTAFVVGGSNYGQGSSREHAALAPRYLGVRAVIALGFARIHRSNLINYGILPLTIEGLEQLEQGDRLRLTGVRQGLSTGTLTLENLSRKQSLTVRCEVTPRELEALLAGGMINRVRKLAGVT